MGLFSKDKYIIKIYDIESFAGRFVGYVTRIEESDGFYWNNNYINALEFDTKEDAENACWAYLDSLLISQGCDWSVIPKSRAIKGYGDIENIK